MCAGLIAIVAAAAAVGALRPAPVAAAPPASSNGCLLVLLGTCVLPAPATPTPAPAIGKPAASAAPTAPAAACVLGALGVCLVGTTSAGATPPPGGSGCAVTLLNAACVGGSTGALVTVGPTVPTGAGASGAQPGGSGGGAGAGAGQLGGGLGASALFIPTGLQLPAAGVDATGRIGGVAALATLARPAVTTTRDLGPFSGLDLANFSLWRYFLVLDLLVVLGLVLMARRFWYAQQGD